MFRLQASRQHRPWQSNDRGAIINETSQSDHEEERRTVEQFALPILVVLAAALVLLIVLVLVMAHRTQTAQNRAADSGVRVRGASASTSFEWPGDGDSLVEKVAGIVQQSRKYRTMTTTPDGLEVQVRGSFWSWGEVISLSYDHAAGPIRVEAQCRPRVRTTVYDYGQCGKDLTEFLPLIRG